MKRKITSAIMVSILLILFVGCSDDSTAEQVNDISIPTDAISYIESYADHLYEQEDDHVSDDEDNSESVEDITYDSALTGVCVYGYVYETDPGDVITDGWHYDYYDASYGDEGDWDLGEFRPRHYDLPGTFVDLIGNDVYHNWWPTRSQYERDNVNIAVCFINAFNISREDFTRANDELRQIWESIEACASQTALYEVYPVDLIFTFDNERINEYFRWRNSPGINDFGMGKDYLADSEHRILFYYMPPPFMELVGRETFIQWRNNRSPEERENESIAVSFVRHFNISRRDFASANDLVQQNRDRWSFTVADGGIWEVYDVNMIFSMDSAAINEFFLMENSLATHERELAATRNEAQR